MAPKMLGESTRGRHIHSIAPDGATSATVSQSDRKAYSAMGGNALAPVRGSYSRSRMGSAGAGAGPGRSCSSGLFDVLTQGGQYRGYPAKRKHLVALCQPQSTTSGGASGSRGVPRA